MKKLIVVGLLVLVSGCASKQTIVKIAWPDAPPELLAPSEELTPLEPNQTALSDLLQNANINYAKYYTLRDRYDAWQQWYKTQQKIYQDIK